MLFAKVQPAELASRTAAGFAAGEEAARQIWASVGGTVEAWFNGVAADDWDVIAVVTVDRDALYAVANAMVRSGVLDRADFVEIRTSKEADDALAAFPALRPSPT
jgi:hypothetical protein